MPKLTREQIYRNDGMAMLYRIACKAQAAGEDPMKAMEAEIKWRSANMISAPIAKKELEELIDRIRLEIESVVGCIAIYVLNGHFGFGRERAIDFLYWFNLNCESLGNPEKYGVRYDEVREYLKAHNIPMEATRKELKKLYEALNERRKECKKNRAVRKVREEGLRPIS